MDFKTLYKILRRYLGYGKKVAEFFPEFMEMITDIPEEDWNTSKDPANLQKRKETLRHYATRPKLPKDLASAVVHNLSFDNFRARVNSEPRDALSMMADELTAYDSSIDVDNLADKLADLVKEQIQIAAGLIKPEVLVKQREHVVDARLKEYHGEALLVEEEFCCPYPGCGVSLILSSGTQATSSYEVAKIQKNKGERIDNLIALCPHHHADYKINHPKKLTDELLSTKKLLKARMQWKMDIDDATLDAGLTKVIKGIEKSTTAIVNPSINFDPAKIEAKIDRDKEAATFNLVYHLVMYNFDQVNDTMKRLSKQKVINFEEFQHQMRGLYLKASKTKKDKLQIFSSIVNRVQKASQADVYFCQILVAYFVQLCEVFDATAK